MKTECIDEDTSQNDSRMIQKSSSQMSKMAEESYNDARVLVNKFTLWREESQRRLVSMIDSYNNSIDKSFTDLVKEVSDLHAKISVIKEEVDDSHVDVDDFSDCLRQQSSDLPHKAHMIDKEENKNHDTPRQFNPRSPISNAGGKSVDEPRPRPRTDEEIKALKKGGKLLLESGNCSQ